MYLHRLLKLTFPKVSIATIPDYVITLVTEDSRQVIPGSLFIARTGSKVDGNAYLTDAYARGAVAAVVSARNDECKIPQIVMPDPSSTVSPLAHLLLGQPSRYMKVFGVTGTNGKTTTAYLLRHLLKTLAHPCGMIGTVETDDGKVQRESDMTTPGAAEVVKLLSAMHGHGCHAAAMEVSSHALHQHRVSALQFAGAGFTNLTGDHLDYHGTMENYAASKAMLFDMLPSSSVAVVNGEDQWTPRMIRDTKARVVKFSFGGAGDYRASDIEVTADGTKFTLHAPKGTAQVSMSLIGRHNIENALTALALVGEVYSVTPDRLAVAMNTARGAPGRLQAVKAGQPFAVLVDYAHTDDALQNVLTALRPLTKGKLRVVFGCGGDRDKSKRPRMGKVAETLADALYITSDNPRTEDPAAILADIQAGLTSPPAKPTVVEVDRRVAIARALKDAVATGTAHDVVLIAGKGHENYQIIGTTKQYFDDLEEARRALSNS